MLMNAIQISSEPDQQGRLELSNCPVPVCTPDHVVIKVAAAGVNHADIFQAEGRYPPPSGASPILGLEVSGVVLEVGENVSHIQQGDRVCALLEGGGYAEYALAPAGQVLPVPDGVSMIDAAGIPEVWFTVWSNLYHHADLQKGESILVHGGASGIGTAAIQLAKAFGHSCYTTAGSVEKCKRLEELGASVAICYRDNDFVEVIKSHTDGRGVDVVLDMVGGDYFQKNMKVLARYGRLISIAFLQGAKAEVNFAPMLMKNLTLKGTTLRSVHAKEKAQIAKELQEHVWPLFSKGVVRPMTDAVFPLDLAEKAHQHMKSRSHFGKIVLQIV